MFNKNLTAIAGSAALAGLFAVAGSAAASDMGIVYKQAAEEASYCHIKYMAMTPQSLQSGVPEFNPSDVIDMYGPCNFDPQSPDEIRRQAATMNRNLYGDSGNDSGSSD